MGGVRECREVISHQALRRIFDISGGRTADVQGGWARWGSKVKHMSNRTDTEVAETNVNGDTSKLAEGKFWCENVEPWAEPVDGTLLLNEIAGILRRFVVLPKWAPEALALWVCAMSC